MSTATPKALHWMGSSKKDLSKLPGEVQDTFGYALHLAQIGGKYDAAKPLAGFGSAGVLEVVESLTDNTYRAVYTVKLEAFVYVLHCFQKKSTKGIETPRPDMELIKSRLADAKAHNAQWLKQEGTKR